MLIYYHSSWLSSIVCLSCTHDVCLYKMLYHTYQGNSNYNTLCLLQCTSISFLHIDISIIGMGNYSIIVIIVIILLAIIDIVYFHRLMIIKIGNYRATIVVIREIFVTNFQCNLTIQLTIHDVFSCFSSQKLG